VAAKAGMGVTISNVSEEKKKRESHPFEQKLGFYGWFLGWLRGEKTILTPRKKQKHPGRKDVRRGRKGGGANAGKGSHRGGI